MTISNYVDKAFAAIQRAIPEAVKTITVRHLTADSEYDPETGTTADTSTDVSVTAVLTSYKTRELERGIGDNVDRLVRVGDMKVLTPYSSLGFLPSTEDKVLYAGDWWDIIDARTDPTQNALVVLQIRKA